ncbi:MAG: flagellar FlbD family protein [Phycisphaeraceae bacterium]
MITVHRLNGKAFVINAELIRTVEANPDTTITLVNGDHILVQEPMDRVVELAVEYGQTLRRLLPLD